MSVRTFQCPNCGSTVTVSGAEKEVTCAYCGSSVIVPAELREAAPQPTPQPQPMQYTFGQPYQPNDQGFQNMPTADTVAKAAIGFTAASFILPIILTCVILAAVGGILFYVFSNVNSTISQANQAFSTAAAPFPTAVPAPTEAPTPTLVPTPAIPTPVPFTKVLFNDNFTDPSSGWSRAKNQNYTEEYKNGSYHILLASSSGRIVWTGKSYTNVSVEVDVKETAGANDATMGIACRASTNGAYTFEFDQNGDYGIYKSDSSGNSNSLAEGTLNPNTVIQNDTNHIEGVCDGDTLTMILNNQVLAQVQDSELTKGGVGMVVTAGSGGSESMDVLFSSFVVKGPQ
jgi:DNA-directed RNA polymerase subunit RPC12/RpoP